MNISVSIHEDALVARTVRELALEGYEGPGRPEVESREKYVWLRKLGSRLWLDTGDMAAAEEVWGPELEGLTTNNTLVNQVVQTGSMDGLVGYAARKLREARPDISEHDLVLEVGFLINAKLALGLVQKFGGHVSVELHPDVAYNVESTLTFARRYYEINPDFFYIKIPLTPDGLIAARTLADEGIPVNLTLGFSARQNYLVTRFSRPRYVNIFLGRLNSLVEENGLGKPENVGEKAALASDEVVDVLRETYQGTPTEQIAASIRSGSQIPMLAGIDVLTIPPKAAREYLGSDITKDDVHRHNSRDLIVDLADTAITRVTNINDLWDIENAFIVFVEDAVVQADSMRHGHELVRLAEKHDMQLFSEWTDEERQRIREKGKIPDLAQWPGAAVDDLMSISALQSFVKDQAELDARIEGLIREAE